MQISGTSSKRPSSACTSTVVVIPDPISPAPSTSSTMKTPENTEDNLHDPEQADEGDIQTEHSSD